MTDAYVVGVGLHPFGRFPGKSMPELARDSIWAAIRDGMVDPRLIGIAYVANCYNGFFTGQGDAVAPMVIAKPFWKMRATWPSSRPK